MDEWAWTLVNSLLLAFMFFSYIWLFGLTKFTVKDLFFGMDERFNLQVLVPILFLSLIAYIYIFVYIGFLIDFDETLSSIVTGLLATAAVWAPLLVISMEYYRWVRYLVVLDVFGISACIISLTVFVIKGDYESDVEWIFAIISLVIILFQSSVDSLVWSYHYLRNG